MTYAGIQCGLPSMIPSLEILVAKTICFQPNVRERHYNPFCDPFRVIDSAGSAPSVNGIPILR
jgi:hypothetical protein